MSLTGFRRKFITWLENSIGKFITWRGNSTLNCTRKPISHESRSDECDIGFQVQFNVEFPRQVMNFPIVLSYAQEMHLSHFWSPFILRMNFYFLQGNWHILIPTRGSKLMLWKVKGKIDITFFFSHRPPVCHYFLILISNREIRITAKRFGRLPAIFYELDRKLKSH